MSMAATTNTTESKVSKIQGTKTDRDAMIDRHTIQRALDQWAQGLLGIAKAKMEGRDYVQAAKLAIAANYNYDEGPVLFKPTLAQENAFRLTEEGALSYFVGGNSKYPEDNGFALNPWASVEFDLAGVIEGLDQGVVMGNKVLKNTKGETTIANFTMGFKRDRNGRIKINLHHSSLPFRG